MAEIFEQRTLELQRRLEGRVLLEDPLGFEESPVLVAVLGSCDRLAELGRHGRSIQALRSLC
jgi:hypothetical protein